MHDYAGLRRLRNRFGVRIAAGENEHGHYGFRILLEEGALDVVQPDVIKSGGVSVARKIIAMAVAADSEICLHSFCFGPGIAATLHVALTTPRCEMIEINPHELVEPVIVPGVRPRNGCLEPLEAPGLGVAFSASARAEIEAQTGIRIG